MASAMKGAVSNLMAKVSTGKSEPSQEEIDQLKQKYNQAGQGQVFTFFNELSSSDKAALYHQLTTLDPDRINVLAERSTKSQQPSTGDSQPDDVQPLPENATASMLDSDPADLVRWYNEGLGLIAETKVAVVLMAGGQGTRLGSSAPKGCFDIGLPSGKSLFQIQAERIARLQTLAANVSGKEKVVIPWYIMTSGPTRKATENFFEEHSFFGLDKDNVVIFEQGVLPCISNDGKILLDSKSKVAVAPDGNGGIYQALLSSGVRDDMKKRGIEHIHAYCVDNSLVKVADPVFVGFAASKDVDIATKVVRKRNATESVGLIVLKNGKPDVVEYSEIDKATAEAKDPKNPEILKFRAANIVNHYYSFRFLASIENWVTELPHHVARKKIPCVDIDSGESIKPERPNGIKLEQFVFDVFPLVPLGKFASIEVRREDEFSPLKNARGTGEDDPDTSKRDIMQQGRRWIQAAGGNIANESEESAGVEVSPAISYGGEGLEFLCGRTVKTPALFETESLDA